MTTTKTREEMAEAWLIEYGIKDCNKEETGRDAFLSGDKNGYERCEGIIEALRLRIKLLENGLEEHRIAAEQGRGSATIINLEEENER